MIRPPPTSPLFPHPTLSRPHEPDPENHHPEAVGDRHLFPPIRVQKLRQPQHEDDGGVEPVELHIREQHHAERRLQERIWSSDRKSTRLNSSHLVISYAVFCL